MEYTPGRVYRHKRRVGKKYRGKPCNYLPLQAALSLAVSVAAVATLLAWCRGVI